MKKPLVIFGSGDLAQLAHYYFSTDSGYEVVAFTIDAIYIKERYFCGLPVIAFEDITQAYPPGNNDFFVAIGYSKRNAIRKEKFLAAKKKGYKTVSFISSRATVLNDGKIGENCFILEDNTIQPFVRIGDNVTLWSGNHIGHHCVIHDHCFISSHVVISARVDMGEQCFVGVNATLRDHIRIGDRCVIGAGVLMLTDAPSGELYIGTATESEKPSRTRKGI